MKIGMTSILVDDLAAEHARLVGLGVSFSQDPQDFGPVTAAFLDDTCGNFVQLVQQYDV